MVKRIDSLTTEQKEMMPKWVDKWTKIGLRTGKTDWKTFEEYIPRAYKKAEINFPNKIVRVNSPIVGAYSASLSDLILQRIKGKRQKQVNNILKEMSNEKDDGVNRDVNLDIVSAIAETVESVIGYDASSVVMNFLKNKKIPWHYWFGGQFWVGGWWGSSSFVSFFTDVCDLELDKDNQERAEIYRKLCESVNYFWVNKNFVIVCARPKRINRNSQGQLHSDEQKSIEYPDGWGLYHLHGVMFSEKLWKRVVSRKMPFENILAIENVDQRTQAMKYGKVGRFLEHVKAKLLDKYTKYTPDKREVNYWLYEIPQGDIFTKEVYYMVYEDPSTFELHMSGVPKFDKIPDAMAWKMSDDEYKMSSKDWERMRPLIDET